MLLGKRSVITTKFPYPVTWFDVFLYFLFSHYLIIAWDGNYMDLMDIHMVVVVVAAVMVIPKISMSALPSSTLLETFYRVSGSSVLPLSFILYQHGNWPIQFAHLSSQ